MRMVQHSRSMAEQL